MKKLVVAFLAIPLFLMGCSMSAQNNADKHDVAQSSLQSWAYPLVTWNGYAYKMTDEVVSEVGKQIGTIKNYSSNESSTIPNLFSNKYPKGTKLYKIKNVGTDTSIAVQDNNVFYKADKVEGMKTAAQ
jgi:uncharacterized lipoprotein NlpE involved in copper resistance